MKNVLLLVWYRIAAVAIILLGFCVYVTGHGDPIALWAAIMLGGLGSLRYVQIMLNYIHPNRKGWIL